MSDNEQPKVPAQLPPHSRAAAAQRLDERPLPAPRGHYYDVPYHPLRPKGARMRQHLKYKNLHRSNQHYAATDRAGTRWSLLPLAFAILTVLIAAGGFFAGYAALSQAVDQRYQGDIVTLADILPKDSLRMYDASGGQIYED